MSGKMPSPSRVDRWVDEIVRAGPLKMTSCIKEISERDGFAVYRIHLAIKEMVGDQVQMGSMWRTLS